MRNANGYNGSENKTAKIFKIVASAILSAAVLAMFVYVAVKGDLIKNALSLSCVGACFLLSLIFIRLTAKKILLTCALGVNVAADFFFVFSTMNDQNKMIWVGLLLGVQFMFFIYTLSLFKGIGAILANAAFRAVVCLVCYFIIMHFYPLGVYDTIGLMAICNSFATLLWILFAANREWLTLVGYVVFFTYNVLTWWAAGAANLFGVGASFAESIAQYNLTFYFYIPALLLIALSSVWLQKENKGFEISHIKHKEKTFS